MTPANRTKLPARRRLVPAVDRLEARALLSASTVTDLTAASLAQHSETLRAEIEATFAAHAAADVASHATIHSASTATSTSKKLSGAQLKVAQETVAALTDDVVAPPTKRTYVVGGGPSGGYGPANVAGAYGVTALGVANEGQGQTIGIVDQYDDANITTDANAFSSFFGLPTFNSSGGPTLSVIKDTALGNVPSAAGTGVGTETSLDVEWAHALAPKANILLVEVPAPGNNTSAGLAKDFADLLQGVQYAASHGASVVSLSYGFHEATAAGSGTPSFGLPELYTLNQTYLNTSPISNVAVTVSTGDTSYPGFPGTSPNVIGVGGTALTLSGTNGYGSESAWGSTSANPFNGAGGGGPSAFFSAPTFQSSNTVLTGGRYRTVPDVSLLADPSTGVAVYDSLDFSGNHWSVVGGTSLASPLFAAELSIVQQQRVAASKPILTTSQIQSDLYALYNSPNYLTYFHDITTGNTNDAADGYAVGNSTSTGYDLATGLGSPIANKLIPYLASL